MIEGVKGNPDPEILRLIQNGAKMASALPYIEDEVGKMIEGVKTKAMKAIAKASLTPEEALALWQELYSYDRLLKRLNTHVAMGKSAAENVEIKIGE